MLYELRMYRAGPGRVQDVADRMRDLVPAYFAKHGFPVPYAEWIVSAGAGMPRYVWLLSWPDSAVRAKAFAGLYGDPGWAALRRQTNGPREMVLKYDIYLMHAAPAWEAARRIHADRNGAAHGIHELRIYEHYPGRAAQLNDTLATIDLPALRAAGATTLGLFDIQSGPNLPAYVHFMHWPDYETRERGLAEYESDPAVRAARAREVAELNTYLLGHHDTWLLRPMPFRIANFHFERDQAWPQSQS